MSAAKYKIGATDGGDAGLDLSWRDKLSSVDGAVLITKNLTSEFINAVKNLPNVIVHATCTGYGGTVVEPNVPSAWKQFHSALNLVRVGFPKERVVIRIDPIIPTPKGIERARQVFKMFMWAGFPRYRVSIIDMYPHVRERFRSAGLPVPYDGAFSPGNSQVSSVDDLLAWAKGWYDEFGAKDTDVSLRIEACAEPRLAEAIQCGCVSGYDLRQLGLVGEDEELDSAGYQRKNCLCYSGKVELLTTKKPCPHGCLYCFWKRQV